MRKLTKFIPFLSTCLLGTLLHFLYDWTGESLLVAPFSGVNESTWEHMKLLYWSLLIVALVQGLWLKRCGALPKNFLSVKFIGTLTGFLLMPVLYYTYNGCFGRSTYWMNIAIFYLCAAAVFGLEARLFSHWRVKYRKGNTFALAGLAIFGFAFIYYTFCPPLLPLFQDPVNGVYGTNHIVGCILRIQFP